VFELQWNKSQDNFEEKCLKGISNERFSRGTRDGCGVSDVFKQPTEAAAKAMGLAVR
jgi:hypothetical protein